MKILSSFTHPQVVPNLYEFLSYIELKRKYFHYWVNYLIKELLSKARTVKFLLRITMIANDVSHTLD